MRVVKNVRIPVRDGIRLAADIYLPAEVGEGVPVVLEYIPYRKDDVAPGGRFYERLVEAGYAVARVDIRGTGGSEGVSVDEYTVEEQLDGVATVEWLAHQPFCDGQVNMIGISYGGFTSLQVASRSPASLRSIIPIDFTHDRYTDDCHYRGGLLRMYYDPGYYGTMMVAKNALPADPDLGADWAEIWTTHLERDEPYLLNWLHHQTDGPYWRNGSVGDVADRIQSPVFMIGGWRDGYPNPPVELYNRLTVPRKLLIGPWNHALPDAAVPGPRIDYLHEVIRWLDHWCQGRSTGIMDEPPVTLYVQHGPTPAGGTDAPGEWRAELGWPPPHADVTELYLGDGALTTTAGDEGVDQFTYDPTVGLCGGLWSGGVPFGLPDDQRPDEARSLVYTSPSLDGALTIIGRARAHLHVSTTASVVGFTVSLSDVSPDGSSNLVTKGMLNGTRRRSLVDPEPVTPGEILELEIELDATAWRFAEGHRVRLAVASADFPNVWPTPEPATNAVHRGGACASRIVLPVVPVEPSAQPPEFRPAGRQPSAAPPGAHRWEVTRDQITGHVRVLTAVRSTTSLDRSTTVETECTGVCQVNPLDPAHASATGTVRSQIDRAGRRVQSTAKTTIQGSPSHLHVTISLLVEVDERPVSTRTWTESIARELL
jgi:putative CocE/NonD family hydrolase